ncbi:hypothetical protein LU293_01235 [Moraxella nasovis]|uniref:hypothetical protein n=1 Tax=Moraxella nasovis TaxID=2904121 RepID=UPI001F6026C4|nr:hypothetical protein [Moraxella nasovis]UNU73566.1 hypothetical protein LU293_01235 [Moraxella nasovis]
MNIPLLTAIFSIASTVAMGILIIIAVVTGHDSSMVILAAVVVGLIISLPVAVIVTKKLSQLTSSPTKAPQ